ncbi:MAG: PilZ domain-containing protein [Gammaproteobacteria bacterium]|nr:PilZ domain-containing protein [Gammaproteobacteria bacterium]
MEQERRVSDRKKTREVADLYFEDQFIRSCNVSCVSPTGVFVRGMLPHTLTRGMRVDLYFPIDPITMPDDKLLCLRGVITRKTNDGTGIRVFSKRLPIVPPALQA